MDRKYFESKTTAPNLKPFRLLGILFCLTVLTAGLTGGAGAYGIEIYGDTITPSPDSTWSYTDGTLTLNNAKLEYIYVTGVSNLIIKLNGENKITGGYAEDESLYGIYVSEDVTILEGESGSGSLNVMASGDFDNVYGIYADNGIKVESGYVKANAKTTDGIYSYGVCSEEGDIIISGGAVDANAEMTGDGEACGIYAEEGKISISGGEVKANAKASGDSVSASGIYLDNLLEISGGEIKANAKATGSGYDYAYGVNSDGYITITGGDLSATAESAYGAFGIHSFRDVSISGSAHVNAVASTTGYGNVYGVVVLYADVTVTGGEITAVGKDGAILTDSLSVSPSFTLWASRSVDGSGLTEVGLSDVTNSEYKYVEMKDENGISSSSSGEGTEPDTAESPMPILAALAGLGCAAVLRRK